MDSKLIGSILLIVGSCIGAAILGLPIATAKIGFIGTFFLLIGCWFVMTAGAFLILEVNLWCPLNSNLITMAKSTIGPAGRLLAWVTYLLLLYSLLSAYISTGTDVMHNLLLHSGLELPISVLSILFTIVFGSIVYLGIRSIDYVNRGLMFVKFGALFLLIILLTPYVSSAHLAAGHLPSMLSISALTVTMSSFGFATIIPSLRIYFNGDVKKLKKAIMIGSMIPLLCYIAWVAVIMGAIPRDGEHGLIAVLHSGQSTSSLVNIINSTIQSNVVEVFTKLFTTVCVLTSFLGVALCLADFLSDGMKIEKTGAGSLVIHAATFLPPLIIVLFFPNVFIKALEYAGIYCIVLLILLPAWMAWNGRYRKRLVSEYTVYGGKPLLIGMIGFSVVTLGYSVISIFWNVVS